ncbi:MAG: hypothetical protein M5U34_10950 [Chloroflexi bacterium]|nr:hypothetical protein [Chloroflexota bacterium]
MNARAKGAPGEPGFGSGGGSRFIDGETCPYLPIGRNGIVVIMAIGKLPL